MLKPNQQKRKDEKILLLKKENSLNSKIRFIKILK